MCRDASRDACRGGHQVKSRDACQCAEPQAVEHQVKRRAPWCKAHRGRRRSRSSWQRQNHSEYHAVLIMGRVLIMGTNATVAAQGIVTVSFMDRSRVRVIHDKRSSPSVGLLLHSQNHAQSPRETVANIMRPTDNYEPIANSVRPNVIGDKN